jgi:hypothetical protein
VGKSTIMSLLAGAPWAGESGSANLHEPPFAQQPPDVVLQAAHQTSGIDLYVTGERLLLLDTQPLLSPSVLLELQRRETSLIRSDSARSGSRSSSAIGYPTSRISPSQRRRPPQWPQP